LEPGLAYLTDHMGVLAVPSDRRAELFRERPRDMLARYVLGTAWALKHGGLQGLAGLIRLGFEELMAPDFGLPDPDGALAHPPGLAGVAHDLSVETLIAAYSHGLYPFAHIPPVKWWSPPTRSLLLFDEAHIGRTTRQQLRKGQYSVTFDRDFEGVIAACAGPRTGRWRLTWITPRIMRAYADLFDAGYAHSFEVWNEHNELVGGGYGVAIGASFSGESQFSHARNASKLGMCVLNYHLDRWGYHFDDGKILTPTTRDFGFREVPRDEYLARLQRAVRAPGKPGRWQVEAHLAEVAAWRQPAKVDAKADAASSA
jgi:leucyl/phenylalanyl-tRNA--protein transferase